MSMRTHLQFKPIIPMTVLLVLLAATLQAQTRINVAPDNFPLSIGALNRAIEQHGGNVIYVLQNGGSYFLEAAMDYDHDLHIEAQVFPSDNPPIIRPGADLFGGSYAIGRYRGNVTAKGIFFYGIDDLGSYRSQQVFYRENSRHHYAYCYFAGGSNYMFEFQAKGMTLRIENSQVANVGRHQSQANQRFIDIRQNDTDSVIVTNTSVYNINQYLFLPWGSELDYFLWDHNTVVNHSNQSLRVDVAREAIIQNSLFYNTSLSGTWESEEMVGDEWPHYGGPFYIRAPNSQSGKIRALSYEGLVDPELATDNDRTIIVRNNNFGGIPLQPYVDYWQEISTYPPTRPLDGQGFRPYLTDPQWAWQNPSITPDDPVWAFRDTVKVVRIVTPPFDSTLTAWKEQQVPWAVIENNIEQNVPIVDMPDGMVHYLDALWYTGQTPHHQDRWDLIADDPFVRFYHPGPGTPSNPAGPTASWFRNLSYGEDVPSYSHALNGYPVGSLMFYPDMKALWEAGEIIDTHAELQGSERPASFAILGSYPNPFNPSTRIAYELGTPAEVTMHVYSVLGHRVARHELGHKSSGQHQAVFDAGHLSSGVYIVRMYVGGSVQSLPITLLK